MQWLKLTTPGNHEIFVNMSLAVHMRRFGEKTTIDMLTSALDRTHAIGVTETPGADPSEDVRLRLGVEAGHRARNGRFAAGTGRAGASPIPN